ncbi:MAG: nicotinate-nucleotide adenylyltransferase [Chloroflexi bacterium]|nr:nicotinate-nucleotide adenylyltransferase [Chloroflexota bacterium]
MRPLETGCGVSGSPKVGVLGGSFDPVHVAHLIIAEEARVRLGLSKVIFVPAGHPYMKAERGITAPEQRLEMVRLAVSSNPYFEASSVDVERAGPSYTVDTLEVLRNTLPAGRELYFIAGFDSLGSLPLWREPGRILDMCWLVGIPRPGVAAPDLERLEKAIPGVARRVVLLNGPVLSISSTDIRDRVAAGLSIRYLVPEAVECYIREKGLYQGRPVSS